MATKVKSYRDLIVWQKAMDLVVAVYRLTHLFPREEQFGLTAHGRKSVVSIPSNIAEGQARNSTSQFLQHISIAYGSLAETETQLLVALRLAYITRDNLAESWALCVEVGKMLNGLRDSLEESCRSLTTGH
ncbi:MAG: four helix bundle protein [Phycisphaerae bacterium]|nr:four helix bundle protein [Phycisphaerae bacterium]